MIPCVCFHKAVLDRQLAANEIAAGKARVPGV